MKPSAAFNTLEFMDELKKAGIKVEEAEAYTKATFRAFTEAMETKELATKKDLMELKLELLSHSNEMMWKTIGMMATFQTLTIGIFALMHYCSG